MRRLLRLINTCKKCGSSDLDERAGMTVCNRCGWCPQDPRVAR